MKSPKILFIILGMALAISCTTGGDKTPQIIGNSIFVPNSSGESVDVSLDFEADWQLSGQSPWFVVTPMSGSAGTSTLHVSVIETNSDLKERTGSFEITCNGNTTVYYVIQDVTPGFNITTEKASVSSSEQTTTLTLEGNVKYSAVPAVDWITVNSIEYDSTLLEDNMTYSKYMTSRLNITVSENTGELREGTIDLTGEDGVTTASVTVEQIGRLTADYTKVFIRRSLALKFTATWCQFCPFMSQALEEASEEFPDHIVAMNMHILSSNEALVYPNVSTFLAMYMVDSYPTGIVNSYAQIGSFSNPSIMREMFLGLAEEATVEQPSNTVIGGLARVSDGEIVVDISIASKKAGSYYLNAFLLEDGMVYPQTNGGEDYVHNDIVRTELTSNAFGDHIELEANGNYETRLSMRIPSSVENQDNLHVVVFTSYRGTYDGGSDGVKNVVYENYGYVVDNAVNLPLGSFINYAYENIK